MYRTDDAESRYPGGLNAIFDDLHRELPELGFNHAFNHLWLSNEDNLVKLFSALSMIKAMPWGPDFVRELRAFKVDAISDFTRWLTRS